jgi:D-amino-acid dehydrogenase
MKKKIAVIGAGIAGISSAYWLAKSGYDVTVFDKERYSGMATSYANGSQLSVCNSPVWTQVGMIQKGLMWMFKKDAPFYISPKFDLQKINWLSQFLLTTMKNVSEENTIKTIQYALNSRNALDQICIDENIGEKFDRVNKGILHVYRNKSSFDDALKIQKLMEDNGCEWEPKTPQECFDIEPTLPTNKIIGGIYTSSDYTGDMHKFITELTAVMIQKYGVNFVYDTKVSSPILRDSFVQVGDDSYHYVVIANGAHATEMAKKLGDNHLVYPVKGYSITVDLLDNQSIDNSPWVSLLDDDAKIVLSRLGENRLRVAGTAELGGWNLDIKKHRIDPLLNWTREMFPSVSTRQYKSWAGLRPMTPTMLPIVGRGSNPRVFYNIGLSHLGWTMGPGLGKIVAEKINNENN